VHHFVGFREMAKRSKEEHGGDPNATGKRSIRAAEYCDQKSAEQQTRDNHHVLHRCCPNAGIELRRMALSNKEQEKRIVVPYFKQFSSALRGDLKHCYEQAY
jgi:hypothetical protein